MPTTCSLTEGPVLTRYAASLAAEDPAALAELFDCLAPVVCGDAVRGLGHHAAAQDVVQDVFVDLCSHPGRHDPDAGPLRGYLTMQARHPAVDLNRQLLESS